MKKIANLMCVGAIMLMLGACSSTVNNHQLISDILLIPKLWQMNEVRDLTIIEMKERGSVIDYKISATLVSEKIEITADITMNYQKLNGNWKMNDSSVDIINIKVFELPSVDKVVESITDYRWIIQQALTYPDDLSLVAIKSMEDDLEHGKAVLYLGSSYSDDDFNSQIEFVVQAEYDYETGWEYKLNDYTSMETMMWNGTYTLEWIDAEPSGMIPPSPYFQVGETIQNVTVMGSRSRITQMNGTTEKSISVEMKIRIDGKDYTLNGYSFDDNWHSNYVMFKFKEGYGGTISLEYKPKDDTSAARIIVYSDAIIGELKSTTAY